MAEGVDGPEATVVEEAEAADEPAAVAPEEALAAAEPSAPNEPSPTREPSPTALPTEAPPILRDWVGPEPSAAVRHLEPAAVPERDVGPTRDSTVTPSRPGAIGPSDATREPTGRAVPGAYLPPSAVYPPPGASLPRPVVGAGSASGPAAPPTARAAERPSALTLRALGPPTASWLVVAGSALGVIAFLLPWSPNGVIGSPGDGGYLGRWGLANGAYLLVMAAAFGCLAVQLLETRLPAALRDGVLPLLLGGFLLGLGWTYVAGPFGADLGVQASLLGGLLLAVGGALGMLATSRSAGSPAS